MVFASKVTFAVLGVGWEDQYHIHSCKYVAVVVNATAVSVLEVAFHLSVVMNIVNFTDLIVI